MFSLQAGGELQRICWPVQTPPWQVSGDVQTSVSLHVMPLGALLGVEHVPVDGLHVPATLHVGAVHVTGLEPVHTPVWQVSVCVQALPSSHPVPLFAFVGVEHTPDDGLHVPATLHAGAVHCIAGPGEQAPAWHVSPTVHALPSLQVAPFATGTHVPLAITQLLHAPQAAPEFCQAPFASHVCGCDPLQPFAPGMQLPVQVPLAATHTNWQAAAVFCHVPVASHVCG